MDKIILFDEKYLNLSLFADLVCVISVGDNVESLTLSGETSEKEVR